MKIEDYKGNEIKEGMTLFIISTKSMFSKIWRGNNKSNAINIPEKEWRVIFEYDVIKIDDVLYAKFNSIENSLLQTIEHLINGLQDNYILAIKGLSDIQS